MCQLSGHSVLERGHSRGLFWKCCNCEEGEWIVSLHSVCLSCGNYRCEDMIHRRGSSSSTFTRDNHRPTAAHESSAGWGNGHLGSRLQVPVQELLAMTTSVASLDPAVIMGSPAAVPTELPPAPVTAQASQTSHSPKPEIDISSVPLDGGDAKAGEEEIRQSGADNGISLNPSLPSSSFLARIRSTKRPAFTSGALPPPALTTTSFAPALGTWRDKSDAPETDSADSSVDTPAESEDDSSTRRHNSENAMSSPDIISGNMDRLNIDPGESRSPASDTTDTSSFVVVSGTRGDRLLEQAWFHRNVRRILQTFMRRYQNGRSKGEGTSTGQSSSSEQLLSPSQQQPQDGQRKRKERSDSDDAPSRTRPSTTSKRKKRSQGPDEPECPRPFACPFCKKDLEQYQSCARSGFKKVRHVKQHVLHRSHSHEVEAPTKERLRQRSARGISKEEQWYEIFDTLFPGHVPRPSSPYNDFKLSEQPVPASGTFSEGIPLDEALYIPAEYLTGPGAEVLQRAVMEDPAFSRLSGDTVRSAVNHGLSLLLESFREHRLEPLQPARADQTSARNTVETDSPAMAQTFYEQESHNSDIHLNDSSMIPGSHSWAMITHPSTTPLQAHDGTGGDDLLGQEFFSERTTDGGLHSHHDAIVYDEQSRQDRRPHVQTGQDLYISAESNEVLQGTHHDLEAEWLLDLYASDGWQHLSSELPLGQSSSGLPLDEPRW